MGREDDVKDDAVFGGGREEKMEEDGGSLEGFPSPSSLLSSFREW